jgi:AraC-like DNA-binding protein
MSEKADFMLDRSNPSSDPLSDILSLLKPRNIACGAVEAGEGCLSFPAGAGIKCHAITEGEAWIAVDGQTDAVHLIAGDALILPPGHKYRLASDLNLPSTDYRTVLDGRSPGRFLRWNGGGRVTILSAAFSVDERHAGVLLDILPSVVILHGDIGKAPLEPLLQQMMQEISNPRAGSRLIVEHLATTLLAQALRAYLTQPGKYQVGWLHALEDRKIGAAISAMHANLSRRWTVQSLAEVAVMSRTNFAVRFKRTVGCSPMDYLTRIRVHIAGERLISTDDSLSIVAQSVGYASESAFSHAFRRHFGCSPRHFAKSPTASKNESP